MPNRYIRETLLTSPNFNKLSAEAERHFFRTLLLVDDFGCFESTPEIIRGKCYPLKFEVTVDDVIKGNKALEDNRMILTWEVNGRQYSVYKTFPRQNYLRSLHKRKTPPPPPDIQRTLLKEVDEWSRVYGGGESPDSSSDVTIETVSLGDYHDEEAGKIWEIALDELKQQVSKSNYRTWLEKCVGLTYGAGEFIIAAPSKHIAEYLAKNQASLIAKTLAGVTETDGIKVTYKIYKGEKK